MAKNRNKKRNAAVSMDTTEVIVSDIPQGTPSIEKKNEKKSFWILNLCYTIFSFIAEVKFKLIYLFLQQWTRQNLLLRTQPLLLT